VRVVAAIGERDDIPVRKALKEMGDIFVDDVVGLTAAD
jgi:hypothetical protein